MGRARSGAQVALELTHYRPRPCVRAGCHEFDSVSQLGRSRRLVELRFVWRRPAAWRCARRHAGELPAVLLERVEPVAALRVAERAALLIILLRFLVTLRHAAPLLVLAAELGAR